MRSVDTLARRCRRLFTEDTTCSAQSSNPSRSPRRLLLIATPDLRPAAVYRALRLSPRPARQLAAVALAFGCLALTPVAASGDQKLGTRYFVDSLSGSDARSGTSPAAAWKTLARAGRGDLRPGDRLLLKRGGVWKGSLELTSAGAAGRPIVVTAYGSGNPPLVHGGSSGIVLTGSYLRVTGLHLDGCSWAGISIAGSFDRVDGNVISHNAAGIEVRPGSRSDEILRNELVDNNRMSVLTKTPGDDDSGAFGILLRGEGAHVAENRISGSDAFSYDYGRDGSAIEIYGGRANVIERNVAIDDQAFTELGSTQSTDNTFAYNLFESSLRTATFLVTRGAEDGRGPVLRTHVYNNTAYLIGTASQGVVCYSGCNADVLTLRNNIIVARAKAAYADHPFDEAADVFYGGPVQAAVGPGTVVANPRFQNPSAGDFRLRSSSPAVDRGVPLGYRRDLHGKPVPIDGNGDGRAIPDAGALEYQRPARRRKEAQAGPAPAQPPPTYASRRPLGAQTGS